MATMSRSWLHPGDQFRYWGEESPRRALHIALLIGAILGLFKACTVVWAYEYTNLPSLVLDGVGGFLLGFVVLFFVFFHRREFVLTSDRLIYREGLIRQVYYAEREVPLTDISAITGGESENGSFELLLNSGGTLGVSRLPNPGELREAIESAIGVG